MNSFSPLFAKQLEVVFATGVVCSLTYVRSGVGNVAFTGVIDAFPARPTGVNPGDVRIRVRAADLQAISSPGAPDYITDAANVCADVISSYPEFGGLGVTLQCRRRSAAPQSQQAATALLAVPRMTRSTRDGMSNVSAGAMIYQTDDNQGLRVFDGAQWMILQQYSEG